MFRSADWLSKFLVFCVCVICLPACSVYKQNIMFQLKGTAPSTISKEQLEAEKNYVIQINDFLRLDVFSNKGERLIDPNRELAKNQGTTTGATQNNFIPSYQVSQNGEMKAPMIGQVHLAGLTLREAEMVLQKAYDAFYKECYVTLTFQNKRVVLLGATGGQVIPLPNDNVKLTEVLALAKGFGIDGKAHNIRLIRNEDVYLIDFSTIDGLRKGNMIVSPNDVIYVEPLRRPFIEGLRDFGSIIGLVVSLGTLTILLVNNANQ